MQVADVRQQMLGSPKQYEKKVLAALAGRAATYRLQLHLNNQGLRHAAT